VFTHTVHQPSFSLTDILHATNAARNTINQIIAFAIDIVLGCIMSACGFTGNGTSFVNAGTISASGVSTCWLLPCTNVGELW
jgi:hypothetical protein